MTHDIDIQTERDVMTPTRLSLILGIQPGTMYKAFKLVCRGAWGINSALSEADTNALIFYYADLGNDTAKRLAENRQKETETVAVSGGNGHVVKIEPTENLAEKKETEKKASRWYFIADAIFFAVVGITGYELHFFLGVWGLGLWAIYAGAITISLIMSKDTQVPKTAETGFTAVVIFETLAFFGHLAMSNLLVIRAAQRGELPFRYESWGTLEAPFYIAVAIAAVLSGIVIYAVWIRLNITKELSK